MTYDRAIERAFLAEDFTVFVAALAMASGLHAWLVAALPILREPVDPTRYTPLLLVFVPAWLWCAERAGIHRLRIVAGPGNTRVRAVLATQSGAALAIAAILVAAQVSLNRSLIAVFLLLSTALLGLVMTLQRSWLRRHFDQVQSLIIGDVRPELARELELGRGRRVQTLPDADEAALRARLQAGPVEEVAIAPGLGPQRLRALLETCHEAGITALVPTEPVDLGLPAPDAEVIGDKLYLVYARREPGRMSLLLKGILDRILAGVSVVVFMPLFLALAAVVKWRMGGPVLFVQQRAGLNGRPFPMLKFRTMRVGAEAERDALLALNEVDGPVFKLTDDPRVTPLGRFLRASSLDELPQIFNVLVGHMSLVGPRPLPLIETRELTGAERRRLGMRPGITCLWQVSGRSDLSFKDWMALDLQYIDQWTLMLDFVILLRTVPALLTRKGAR